ncbi:MAG: hypothetical protein QOH58_216 [Thermoleophilaceae bacterium]|jgi:uncharacterized delta-60 repeat protein|nr:hypothetical protein [Thermoleophilaceae bacterium]
MIVAARAVRAAAVALGAIAAVGTGSEQARAAAGAFDPAFGIGGTFTLPAATVDSAPFMAVQPDGKVVITGDLGPDGTVIRLNADGTLDPTFDGDGKVTLDTGGEDNLSAVALQPDGKILVAGDSTGAEQDAVVFRLNPDGSLDTTFDLNGIAVMNAGGNEAAFALALQPDGKIVVGGGNSSGMPIVWRLLANGGNGPENGGLDTSFAADGSAELNVGLGMDAGEIALQPDGRILVASRIGIAPSRDVAVLRLLANGGPGTVNGALDPSFDTDGLARIDVGGDESVSGIALRPDGKVVVAGYTTIGAGGGSAVVLRLMPDAGPGPLNGALDPSFDANGSALVDSPGNDVSTALALQPDGKILLAGASFGTGSDAAVYRLLADGGPGPVNGALDGSFGTAGAVTIDRDLQDIASAVAIGPDRKIVAAAYSGTAAPWTAMVFRLFGDPFALNVAKSGTGSGTVKSTPSAIDCGTACSGLFDFGTRLTLAAAPARGSRFAGWSGGGCSGRGPCQLTLGADTEVSATFDKVVAFGARTLVSLRLAAKRIPAKGPVKVRVGNRNVFAIRGSLSARRKRIKLGAKAFRVGAGAKRTVALRLPKQLRGMLLRRGRLVLRFQAKVRDPAGNTRTVTATLKPARKRAGAR